MKYVLAAVLAAASCAAIAQAQTAPPVAVSDVFTLDDAISLAIRASPAADVAASGERAAKSGRDVAGLRPNPEAQAQVENIVGTGPYRGFAQAETTVGFSLPIELGGKRSARIGVADGRINRQTIETAVIFADLRLRVTEAYVQLLSAERRLTIADERSRITAQTFKAASDRVEVGAASPIEQERASVQNINAQAALAAAMQARDVARQTLESLIGQPISGPLDMAWFDRVAPAVVGPVEPVDVAGTLDVAAANADLTTADAQVRLARSQRIPDLTVSAGARRLSGTGSTAAVVGLSVPIPLFNNGGAAIGQARAERDQADARRRLAIQSTELAIANARADLARAAAIARAMGGPGLMAALEAVRIARTGYGAGKFDQIELLDAERTLAETRTAWIDALVSYHLAAARLKRLTAPVPAPTGVAK